MNFRKSRRSQFILICLAAATIFFVFWMYLGQNGGLNRRTEAHFRDDSDRNKKSKSDGYQCDRAFHELLYQNLESCKEKLQTVEGNCKQNEGDKCLKTEVQNIEEKCEHAENVDIIVNGKQTIEGLKINEEPYVPFSFIKKHFEIYGKYKDEKQRAFEWRHTLIDIKDIGHYVSTGPYLIGSQQGNVAYRSKVKYIHGEYEVPVSNQWDKSGYFYPIQISQFGLSHYSRYYSHKMEGKSPERYLIGQDDWKISEGVILSKKFEKVKNKEVIYFDSRG